MMQDILLTIDTREPPVMKRINFNMTLFERCVFIDCVFVKCEDKLDCTSCTVPATEISGGLVTDTIIRESLIDHCCEDDRCLYFNCDAAPLEFLLKGE